MRRLFDRPCSMLHPADALTGPTDGSVFIRDCRDCTLCVAARQLRTRDCKNLNIGGACDETSLANNMGGHV